MAGPAYHGRTHIPAGTDPIPGLLDATGATTYPDLVLAHSCIVHYWPADEASGDLIDRVGSWDLEPTTAGGYPQYGADGPLTELPEYTAVENAGLSGVGGSASRFQAAIGGLPAFWTGAHPFAIELWAYLTAYGSSSGTSVFFEALGGGGGDAITINLFSTVGPPKGLQVEYGGLQALDSDDFPLDAWQYVVVNFTGTDIELYRNATLVDSAAVAVADTEPDASVTIMNKSASTWFPVNGREAHIAIYDCALTGSDIGSHFEAVSASGSIPIGYVPTADGEGGFDWAPPTIEVEF